MTTVSLVLLFMVGLSTAAIRQPLRDPVTLSYKTGLLGETSSGYKWSEEWLEGVSVDHFSFANKDSFPLRYFINTDHFQSGGPIFFYTGNEGSLEGFAENTGFMWDSAEEFNAAVVFAEHRFYGKTQPFKNESYNSTDYLGYLSSEQALADFVVLIDYLKETRINGAQNSSVVAFGGSYGGMLAAWIRIKYPHKVDGAIAASAPVFWFSNTNIKEDVYDKIVTRSFVNSGCNFKSVQKGWDSIQSLAQTEEGRSFLNNLFHLEEKSKLLERNDYVWLNGYLREILESMAMVNYPYPTSFLTPLPGWPVKKTCETFKEVAKTDEEAAEQMYQIANLYYNYTGSTATLCANSEKCSGAYAALGDPLGWPWQTCTEMVMPLCGNGPPNDFFWKDCPFTAEAYLSSCNAWFGKIGYDRSMMRPSWAIQNYGNQFPTASNIVFSNGYLDPWSGGGWALKPKTEGSLLSLILLEGAHHYDLRGKHPQDTDEVKRVRQIEKTQIAKWIKQARKIQKKSA